MSSPRGRSGKRHSRSSGDGEAEQTMRMTSILAAVVAKLRRQNHAVFLFDYDGTLAGIAPHPRLARMSPRMRRLLADFAQRPDVAVGVLSGRSLHDLRAMVAIPGVRLAGLCGLELDLDGAELPPAQNQRGREVMGNLLRALRQCLPRWPQAWVEDKILGLTVHYRDVPPARTAELLDCVAATLDPFRGDIRTTLGPRAIEVVAALGRTKGTAVDAIVKRLPWRDPCVLFAGDSPNDVEAFAAATLLNGITIGVGADAPAEVQYRLEDPAELTSLLEGVAEAWTPSSDPRAGMRTRGLSLSDLWRPFFPLGPL